MCSFGRRAELEARRQREEEERMRLEEEQRIEREQIEADRRLAVRTLSSLVWFRTDYGYLIVMRFA